jgi:UDP-N-acetylglucosamine/UDP-N-acetylgalactosamine diphosphorylase
MLKKIWNRWGPNPLDRKLKKAARQGCKTVLIPWNRGLGDIALGLYAIVHRVREWLPEAQVTFVTRPDLQEGFQLFQGVNVVIAPNWARGKPSPLPKNLPPFDLILDNPNPTQWVAWQRGKLIPKMEWNSAWDALCKRFQLPNNCIAAHVNCETDYYFERNWTFEKWQELFSSVDVPIILLGLKKTPTFQHPHLIDLRGETSLFEILAIVKNHCQSLIAPDSGILAMTYFLNTSFPLRILSLWADPHHGILKQNVPSPNPLLDHLPIISPDKKNASLIPVSEVKEKLFFTPATKYDEPCFAFFEQGQKDLAAGRAACLILTGGQGSRLGSSQPKALFPVLQNKTLLQLLCEKVLAISRSYNRPLPMALMTSPLNHTEIVAYLQNHHYFGLSPTQVHLFPQEMAPLLNEEGSSLVDASGKIISGPDGNGHALKHLVNAGIAQTWKEQGIETVSILPIENLLADPFDPILIGYHTLKSHDASLKAIRRDDPSEKIGLIVWKNGHLAVQEYSEATFPNSAPLGYIGLLALSLSFIERIAPLTLPWHRARKQHAGQMIWKLERFLFDILPHANRSGVLVYPRNKIYAPLKTTADLAKVQQALLSSSSHGRD